MPAAVARRREGALLLARQAVVCTVSRRIVFFAAARRCDPALRDTQRMHDAIGWDYVPSQDGQRFLMKEVVDEHGSSALAVVLNWQELLRR